MKHVLLNNFTFVLIFIFSAVAPSLVDIIVVTPYDSQIVLKVHIFSHILQN